MAVVYVAMGSNLGKRVATLGLAKEQLVTVGGLVLADSSPYYETEPESGLAQPCFINSVLRLQTDLAPSELLQRLQRIEQALGRQRGIRWGPRTIDLDVLLYDDIVMREEALEIPHPRMHERRFVLEPLCDIAPEIRHPLLGKTARELLEGLNREDQV
ncbi:MAG: 2-amino-4-hydroxy-6-hydroxymethyldihydropteridine diphosphokinase [Planctomycetes bacterium]|nr:2-amino-4-hydroxy-6-hydroxymethyldihydropteridine diphosphokinase [Planctomycetota bacterium]